MQTEKPHLIVRRRVGDVETPISALLKLGYDAPGTFLFESIQGGHQLGRYSFIGLRPDKWWRVVDGVAHISPTADFEDIEETSTSPLDSLDEFSRSGLCSADEDLPPMAAGVFGYLGYDMVRYFEPVGEKPADALGLPEAVLCRPSAMIIFDHLHQELLLVAVQRNEARSDAEALLDEIEHKLDTGHTTTPSGRSEGVVEFTSNKTRADYDAMVARAKDYIVAGDIFQVVPSQRFSAKFDQSSLAFYRALRAMNPSAFMFHMNMGWGQLVGSSPEILVRVRDGRVAVRPIAGTRPRSGDPETDKQSASELLSDPKERAEHLMLLDLGRNDVGRVSDYGSVSVSEQFIVEQYSHVMHIVSHVEGNLRSELTLKDALMAGFPAGTVSGAPKIRAMQIIDELEGTARGVYGGAIGYFGWKGDLDTCIALRTGVIENGNLHIQAGGGIVLDSDPEAEFMETVHKSQALRKAAARASIYEGNQ